MILVNVLHLGESQKIRFFLEMAHTSHNCDVYVLYIPVTKSALE